VVVLVAALAACQGDRRAEPPHLFGAGHKTPQRGGTLRFSVFDDVRSLDPAIGYDEFTMYVFDLLFDTLLAYAPATDADPLRLVPQLAESWTVSADGLTYSFTLRPGVTFSSGEPLGAADFVYTFERLLSPDLPSPGAQFFTGIVGAQERLEGKRAHLEGIRATSDRTLEIRLVKPDLSFPLLLAMKFATPQKQRHVEAVGDRIRDTPLGVGPFVLEEWRDNERLHVVRNPHYWDPGRPYLDGIVMELMVPSDVAALKFQKGEIDTAERLPPVDYLRFAASPAWQPYAALTTDIAVYGELMNVTRPPFSDKRVRQALNYALNKEDTVRLTNGRAQVAHGILPPALPGYDKTRSPYPHDRKKARELLRQAGYPNGFETTYTVLSNDQAMKLAQSLQADLAEVNVKVNIQPMTFSAYVTETGKGNLDFAYTGWLMDFPDPWNFLEVKFHSRMIAPENASNDTGYRNAEVDRLLDEARIEIDPAKRMTIYQRVAAILFEDCPWIFHYHPRSYEVRQPYVMDYVPHPVWRRTYRDTWLDEPRRSSP
jgi:ABC-type transport system substrate-binding protein